MDYHCDRCGALARARYTKGAQDILFCGHHSQVFGTILHDQGFEFDLEFDLVQPDLVNA